MLQKRRPGLVISLGMCFLFRACSMFSYIVKWRVTFGGESGDCLLHEESLVFPSEIMYWIGCKFVLGGFWE